jgi:hypothetical protein
VRNTRGPIDRSKKEKKNRLQNKKTTEERQVKKIHFPARTQNRPVLPSRISIQVTKDLNIPNPNTEKWHHKRHLDEVPAEVVIAAEGVVIETGTVVLPPPQLNS